MQEVCCEDCGALNCYVHYCVQAWRSRPQHDSSAAAPSLRLREMSGRIDFRAVKASAAAPAKQHKLPKRDVGDDIKSSKDAKKQQQQQQPQQQAPEQQGAGTSLASDYEADFSEDERLLRSFDMTSKFGPCTGMTRLERWERADKFGLSPPPEVKELLLRLGPGHRLQQCLWATRI